MEFCKLKRAFTAHEDEFKSALLTVATSAAYIKGPEVHELEQALSAYTQTKHTLSCASGTDALVLALKSLGIGKGDAVICPSFTFFASAEAISIVGAKPVFVDVEEESFNIDPNSVKRALELFEQQDKYNLKALIAVDLFGRLANYSELKALAQAHKLFIIEDFAQAFGAQSENGVAGSFADAAATSFFPTKPLACFGDGGAVVCSDDKAYELMKSLAVHGKGKDKYDNVRIGMNSRLDTLQAAVLLVKLKHFDEELSNRRAVARAYSVNFEQSEAYKRGLIKLPAKSTDALIDQNAWAQYTIKLNNSLMRDALREQLAKKDIPTMVYYERALHQMKAYQGGKSCFTPVSLEVSEKLCATVLSLPFDAYLSQDEIWHLVSSIDEYLCRL